MKLYRRAETHNRPPSSVRREESLSDSRYQDLLKSASALFASAEADDVDSRLHAVAEINELMARYGLSLDDIR